MTEPWTQDWVAGTFGERGISDRPYVDPQAKPQDGVAERMAKYPSWRGMFSGSHVNQELEGVPSTDNQPNYRWPSRVNLFYTYGMIHAAWMWGRGETSKEADDLFDLALDRKIPGLGGPEMTSSVPTYQEALEYWWSHFQHILRPAAATQMWAGGAFLKVSWNPFHPASVYGCLLEMVDPEFVYPIWDPINFDTLLSVKIVFYVGPAVAIEKYGITERQLRDIVRNDQVRVEEYWSRQQYWIRLGPDGGQVVARQPTIAGQPGEPYQGRNPWINPYTQQAVVPVVYIPRVRTQGFFGDSLMENLEGPVEEMNKALSDIGDALNESTHTNGAVADNHAAGTRGNQQTSFSIPRGELMNLGLTPAGLQQGRIYEFEGGQIPAGGMEYVKQFQTITEQVAMLMPGAKGQSSADTGFGAAMEMLPTLYHTDWMRSHWSHGIGGRGQICQILGVMWFVKGQQNAGGTFLVPQGITPRTLMVRIRTNFRAMIPRDRVATVQEITALAVNKVLPPRELLKRLGDVENIDETLGELIHWIMWLAAWDAAVAGRPVDVGKNMDEEGIDKQPAMPLPEVSGPPTPAIGQPAKQPQQTQTKEASK